MKAAPLPTADDGVEAARLEAFCPSTTSPRELILVLSVALLLALVVLRGGGSGAGVGVRLPPQPPGAAVASVLVPPPLTPPPPPPPLQAPLAPPSPLSLGARDVPFGQVWSRWDEPHGARHMTWLVTGARLVVAERRLLVKSNAARPLDLAVRAGSTKEYLFESPDPPRCTHALATGLVSTSVYAPSWNNYWHFNVDDFFLMMHVLMNEHAAGAAGPRAPPSLFMSAPFSVLDAETAAVPPFLPNASLPRFINDEVRFFFGAEPLGEGAPPLEDWPNAVFWLRSVGGEFPEGDALLAERSASAPRDERVICFDRLYVGSDTQCAMNNVVDANTADRGECESVYRMFRAAVATMLGGAEGAAMESRVGPRERPRVVLVDRGSGHVQGKQITDLPAARAEVRSVLDARYGSDGADFELHACSDFDSTARWWATATVVIMTRGACQANMPLTRDGGGVLWIGPCGDDLPQLRPMPAYFATEVLHPPVTSGPVHCNAANITLPAGMLGGALRRLLDTVHPAATA